MKTSIKYKRRRNFRRDSLGKILHKNEFFAKKDKLIP